MTLLGNLGKVILVAIICAGILYLIIPVDFMLTEEPRSLAAIPHENPETAQQVLSGIPSLRFDSDFLNFVVQMNPEEVEAMLRKWPFSHIPQSLKEAASNFIASGMSLSHLVVEIDEDMGKLKALREQSRLDEAIELAAQTSANLSQAYSELEQIEQATKTAGEELKVPSAPAGSDLRCAYDEVLERINRIREMLDLHQETLTEANPVRTAELLSPTELTLKIHPMVAFIGDNIHFWGVLTSEKEPLAGQEVDILLNSSQYLTVKTDAYGHYHGKLQVPYWYTPELELQALYYPRDKDVSLYLTSQSPVIEKMQALFYETGLEVTVEDKAYPGLETKVSGRFDYGQSPPRNQRKVEIYFDDVLIAEGIAREAFYQKIRIDPEVDSGEHIITVSSPAMGRYSSGIDSAILNVTRETPVLDLSIPTVAMIPGSFRLGGKLYSEAGPLSEALIKMELGKSQVELVSSEDGVFDTEIKTGMGLGIIGSQDLVIQVLPQEPWHAPLVTTRTIMMVNPINCGVILAILILFLSVYLPSRLRERLGAYPRRTARPAIPTAPPEPAPAYDDSTFVPALTKESAQGRRGPRNRIFYQYRLIVRLIQGITKALLKPQQTLQEFAKETSRVLGPAAKYFVELTKIVERLLYSQYRPTEKDVGKSKQLSHSIKEEFKGEGV